MEPVRLDDDTAERLLAGAVRAQDAPPGYAGVADLLHAAAAQAAGQELPREACAVASMRAAIKGTPVAVPDKRRKNMLAKIVTTKAAAAAAVLALGGTGAAAATGALPGSAQSTASSVLANVGISVPAGSSSGNPGHGPNAHALFGLCNAESHNAGHPASSVFPSKAQCATVTHPGKSGGDDTSTTSTSTTSTSTTSTTSTTSDTSTTSSTSDLQSSSKQSSQTHGQGNGHRPSWAPAGPPSTTPASGTAAVSTPNRGSASNGASSGHSSNGSSASGGSNSTGSAASSAGSANASNSDRP